MPASKSSIRRSTLSPRNGSKQMGGQSKLIQLRDGLRTMREELKENIAAGRGFQMPIGDRFGSGPPAAPDAHVKRWDDAEMCVRHLGDELDNYIYRKSVSSKTKAGDGATDASEQPKGGALQQADLTSGNRVAMKWQEAQQRLEQLCESGEKYTSQSQLASQLGCSQFTVQKAINKSEKLKKWMNNQTKMSGAAGSLSPKVTDSMSQTREPDPAATLSAEDVDAAMAKLIDEARPDDRARLNAMDEDERNRLARAYIEQQRDNEPSSLGDSGSRAVRHHKRV